MADIYVDYAAGDDTTGDGTSTGTAYQHISKALTDVADPLTEETTIHLGGTCAVSQDYGADSVDTEIDLEDINIQGEGELIIQPTIWVEADYESGAGPFVASTGTPAWDPTGTKPCTVPPVKVDNTKHIIIKGVVISGGGAGTQLSAGISVTNQGSATFHYCTVEDFTMGALIMSLSWATFCNCCFNENGWGIACVAASNLGLVGDNTFLNNMQGGVLCTSDSQVSIQAWDENASTFFTTLIKTTAYRHNYAGVKLLSNSSAYIEDPIAQIDPNRVSIARLKIINDTDNYNLKNYYGLVLESFSKLMGAKNILFSDPDINKGDPTVPDGNQIVGKPNEGTNYID